MLIRRTALALALFAALPLLAETPTWIQRSNENTQILLNVLTRFAPETAAQFGVEGHDAEVTQLPADVVAQQNAALEGAIRQLDAKLANESDRDVRQDLQILIDRAKLNIEENQLEEKYHVPYFNLSQLYFISMRRRDVPRRWCASASTPASRPDTHRSPSRRWRSRAWR